jgi:hypothetical protein
MNSVSKRRAPPPKTVWITLGRVMVVGYSVAMLAFVTGLLIGKLVYESFYSYSSHFTNWNWTILGAFLLVDVVSKLLPVRWFKKHTYTFAFWLAYGSAWSVFWLVFIMFANNPGVLTDLWTEKGGKYSMGFILNMNTVFHTLPAMMMTIYLLLNFEDVLKYNMKYLRSPSYVKLVYALVIVFIPLYIIGIYNIVWNIKTIYGITTQLGILIVFVVGVAVVFNGLTLLWIRISADVEHAMLMRYQRWLAKSKSQRFRRPLTNIDRNL